MSHYRFLPPLTLVVFLAGASGAAAGDPLVELGRLVFFDTSLSVPAGQSCASCHEPAAGWTGPQREINASGAVYPGAFEGRFGKRKPLSAAYATFSPALHLDKEEGQFVGGSFWDGRATGWLLGSPAADQAQRPFLDPVEHNAASAEMVVDKVCAGSYGAQFRAVLGSAVCDDALRGFNAIAQALAAFEASAQVSPFSSKYDFYLKDPGRYPLTDRERRGLALFERKDKGNCAACHPNRPGPNGEPPLFTDFAYYNLGVARNPQNPWYRMGKSFNPKGEGWVDEGLGGFLKTLPRFASRAQENLGKHKVPTLRNVDLRPQPEFVKAFRHNGSLKSLEEVVHFYNTRDVKPTCGAVAQPRPGDNCWPKPEVAENVDSNEVGDLGLTRDEEQDIVAFLKTLSDGWTPPTE